MENDGKTLTIRCYNPNVHKEMQYEKGEGRMLAIFRKNFIFLKCGSHHCKRWTRIKIDVPGVNLDFSNVAFTKKIMPKRYHFDTVKAPLVIEG
jgi:hypothetical protein